MHTFCDQIAGGTRWSCAIKNTSVCTSQSHYADRLLYKLGLQPMSGEMRWDGCTDDRQRPVVNDHITLHGDYTQCMWLTDERLPAAAYVHLLVTRRCWCRLWKSLVIRNPDLKKNQIESGFEISESSISSYNKFSKPQPSQTRPFLCLTHDKATLNSLDKPSMTIINSTHHWDEILF